MATRAPRTIVADVRAYARRHGIFRPGPIVLAVSGGTDSVALALIMAELRDEFGLVLHVAHFDHRTRPRSSAADAAFVAGIADRIAAPIRAGRADQPTKSEDDARRARYGFLRRVAGELGAAAIVTGHTQDDQAETVLLHLARGSGLAGLAAMRPLREGIARPLLAIARADTSAVCAAAKIRPREDPSNRSLRYARNRVRLRVLPELARINPQVRASLARFAEAAAAALPADARDADARSRVAGGSAPTEIALDALPGSADARGALLAELWRAATGLPLGVRHRQALASLVASSAGSRRLDLPGGQAVREYRTLRLIATAGPTARAAVMPTAAGPMPLRRGEITERSGWRIVLGAPADGLEHRGTFDAATAERLRVRARRPGDRIGGRKLQDLFVDAKVPARLRDDWPLITLDTDEVVWVPGLSAPPRRGEVMVAAGPIGEGAAATGSRGTTSTPTRQVASRSEARRQGGKRGRP